MFLYITWVRHKPNFTNKNKIITYGVRTRILYTIYIVGYKYLCRFNYDGTKMMVPYYLKDYPEM